MHKVTAQTAGAWGGMGGGGGGSAGKESSGFKVLLYAMYVEKCVNCEDESVMPVMAVTLF